MGFVSVEDPDIGPYSVEVEDAQIAAAEDHQCTCMECDPRLDAATEYPVTERTSPDHRAVRFGDWRHGDWQGRPEDDPDWYEIKVDGQPIRHVYEVDKPRGIVWAYRDPLHVCLTCVRAARPYNVCAQRITGAVTFEAAA